MVRLLRPIRPPLSVESPPKPEGLPLTEFPPTVLFILLTLPRLARFPPSALLVPPRELILAGLERDPARELDPLPLLLPSELLPSVSELEPLLLLLPFPLPLPFPEVPPGAFPEARLKFA